jgi:competence protein ComEC
MNRSDMAAKNVITRFRAFQLGQEGASFSYFADTKLTFIEARLTDHSKPNVEHELRMCGKAELDVLHITSWDRDHCSPTELEEILSLYKPGKVEYPGYEPHTDTGAKSLEIIKNYNLICKSRKRKVECIAINPVYIKALKSASELCYRNIFYHPRFLTDGDSNNNSTVKLFRDGCFNVASLGDVEDTNIGAYLRRCKIFKREVDILLLAHHGADCATNSKRFLEVVKPKIAICASNYDNKFEHPKKEVRERLYELNIPLFTTKTGDVIIHSLPPHANKFRVFNLISNSTEISSQKDFSTKKGHFLSMNSDTLRNIYRPGFKGLNK